MITVARRILSIAVSGLGRASAVLYAPALASASRRQWLVRAAIQAVAMGAALGYLAFLVRPLFRTPPPPQLPAETADTSDVHYGVPERVRRQVFDEIAARRVSAQKSAAERFPGQPWSIEDDIEANERDEARACVTRHDLTLTQIYLIVDEGIRGRWPGPDGMPLPGAVPPLRPRTK